MPTQNATPDGAERFACVQVGLMGALQGPEEVPLVAEHVREIAWSSRSSAPSGSA